MDPGDLVLGPGRDDLRGEPGVVNPHFWIAWRQSKTNKKTRFSLLVAYGRCSLRSAHIDLQGRGVSHHPQGLTPPHLAFKRANRVFSFSCAALFCPTQSKFGPHAVHSVLLGDMNEGSGEHIALFRSVSPFLRALTVLLVGADGASYVDENDANSGGSPRPMERVVATPSTMGRSLRKPRRNYVALAEGAASSNSDEEQPPRPAQSTRRPRSPSKKTAHVDEPPPPSTGPDHQAAALAHIARGACSCGSASKLSVAVLREISRSREIATRDTDGKLISKRELLLLLCPVCVQADEVQAAIDIGNDRQGVPAQYWDWVVEDTATLSVMSAFHLAMTQRAAVQPHAIASDLNNFRAHLLRVFHVNYDYYMTQGKVNRVNGPGQIHVALPATRVANFMQSCRAALDHYDGIHDQLTCGRLRKGQPCVPFTVFANCAGQVRDDVRQLLMLVVESVLDHPRIHIDQPYPDQDHLRTRFGL